MAFCHQKEMIIDKIFRIGFGNSASHWKEIKALCCFKFPEYHKECPRERYICATYFLNNLCFGNDY